MENINGKHQPRWMLLCATTGLAVSVSFCLAQGNREAQLATAPPETATPFACDSLDPKVCFDVYQRRMERIPAPILSDDQGDNSAIAAGQRLERCLSYDPRPDPFGKPKKDQKLSDYCSPIATRFDLCETKRRECR
jgi:hypothetical protein